MRSEGEVSLSREAEAFRGVIKYVENPSMEVIRSKQLRIVLWDDGDTTFNVVEDDHPYAFIQLRFHLRHFYGQRCFSFSVIGAVTRNHVFDQALQCVGTELSMGDQHGCQFVGPL
jgi:hypothetical protein